MRRALEGTLDEDDDAENVEHEDSPRTAAPADAGTFDGMSDTSDKDHALTQAAQPSSSPSKEDRALLLQAVRLMAQRRKEQERIRDKDRVIGFDGNGDQVNLPSTKRSMVELLGETTLKGKKSRLHLKGSDKDHCGLSSQQSDQERGRKKRSDSGAFEKVRHLELER